jgi:AsmA protein
MNMRKVGKILAIVAGVFVVIVAALAILLRVLVTPEMVRKTVLPRVEKATGRQVELGDVQIGIFTGIGLRNLVVHEREGKEAFVAADEVRLRYQFWPLLARRVVVDEVTLVKPRFRVVRNPDGSFNFSDLLKKEAGPKPEEPKEKTPLKLAVAKISVSDGRVAYDDRLGIAGAPFVYEVTGIGIEVRDFAIDRPFPVKFAAKIPGASLGFGGKVERVSGGPVIAGEFTLGGVDLAALTVGLPAGIAAKLRPLSPGGGIEAKLQLAGETKAPLALLKGGEVTCKEVRVKAGGMTPVVNGRLVLAGTAVSSQGLSVSLGKNTLAIDLKIPALTAKPLAAELSIKGDAIDLDALMPAAKKGGAAPVPVAGPAKPEPGPLNLPLAANGSLRLDKVRYRGLDVTGLVLRYRLANNVFQVEELTGGMAGGTFADTARVDLGRKGFAYATRLSLKGVQADQVVVAFLPIAGGSITGTLSGSADLTGSGATPAAVKRNLAGSGAFAVENGKLTGSGFVQGLAGFLGSEELRLIRFSKFAGTYRIANARVLLDAEVSGADVRMWPQGSVGFDGSLDLVMDTRVAPRIAGKVTGGGAGRFVTDEQGWGILPLKVAGTAAAPRFTLSGKIIRQQIGSKLMEQLQKKKEGKEQRPEQQLLEKGIKGLFGN